MFQYIPWVLVGILYTPIFYQLYHTRWEMIDYTHAYFILPISLALIWLKRKALKKALSHEQTTQQSGYLGLLIIGILMYVFGWRNDYLFISTLSLIPVLFGLSAYLYGPHISKLLRFPFLYLLLVVPPPLGILDALTLPMRYGASLAAYIVLRSFHFPIAHEGLMLSVEGQPLFMGPACSGFRSLITMISLGLIYVYFSKASRQKKVILLFSIIPLVLLGNLIRIIMLCLVTYYFGQKTADGFFHTTSGFVIFVIVVLGLFGVEALLHKKETHKLYENE